MTDPARANSIAAPSEAWRRRVLDLGSAAIAVLGALWLLAMSRQPVLLNSLPPAVALFASIASVAIAAVWRSGPYRVRAGLLLAPLLVVELAGVLQAGFVVGAYLSGLMAIVGAGLLLGVRWAVAAWLASTLILLAAAGLSASGAVSLPFDASQVDPRDPIVAMRFGLSYAILSAFLAVGVSIVVNRLSGSLRETEQTLDELRREQAARRDSEAQWRSLVEHAPNQIAIVDRDHRFEFRNQAVPLGYELDQVLGAPVEQFVVPEHRDPIGKAIDSVFETRDPTSLEAEFITREGERRWFVVRLGPILPGDGGAEIERVVGIAIDVTEQRSLEAQLRQAQKLEAVGQLTGGVAHDFNNLLTVVLGNLELAQEFLKPDSPESECAANATEAALRAATLTQRLLAFSRKQPLRPQPLDVRTIVAGMDDLLRRALGETIEIEVVNAAGLWTCDADPVQIENTILNLAINARDAMPAGGQLTIETSNARLDEEYASSRADVNPGQYVLLAVTDTGTGMPPEIVGQAFDPFFSTKERGRGTGLGLSMVYGFVKQSGGHVAIYSEAGEGTTVKVYLPRAEASRPAFAPEEPLGATPLGQGQHILVVEDDASVRALAVSFLETLGYRACEAGDAAAGLEALENAPDVSLLLTDVILPGGSSGLDLAREAKRRRPDLRIVFTSGYTENSIVHNGRLDRGVELLEKPFTKAELARKLRAVLDAPVA